MAHFFSHGFTLSSSSQTRREALLEEIRLEPEVPCSYDELGRIELKLDHPEQAAQPFQSAIVLDPSLTTPYSRLAQIYRAQNRYADALSMLNHAVARQPNSASLHYLRGQVLARLHRENEVQAALHTAQDLLINSMSN